MAPSSPRALASSRGRPRPPPPPSSSTDSDVLIDTDCFPPQGPASLLPRLEAVDRDAARRKFALYGRQHAHVDHISGAAQDLTLVLQSTVLLQEDGLLAARLDDVSYLLDGLLSPAKTQRGRLAQAHSVLELVQLMQDVKILQAVELSSQRRTIQSKMKQLLLSNLGAAEGEETQRVAMAVLVFFLAGSSMAEEYTDVEVLDAVVLALKREMAREGDGNEEKMGLETSAVLQPPPPRKTCLKRKQRSGEGKNLGTTRADAFDLVEGTSVLSVCSATSATRVNVLDDTFRGKLEKILQGREHFYVEEELQLRHADILCAALSKLLQVDDESVVNPASVPKVAQRRQVGCSDDPAAETFRLIRGRKQQLVRNGGVDVLAHGLARHISVLEALAPSSDAERLSLDFAYLLHRLGMLLQVFDHVTFLSLDVQQYMSQRREPFRLLLKLTRVLSELTWGSYSHRRWEVEPTRMSMAVEVLLSGLRVLINLTHHNVGAAGHICGLSGMQLLARSFTQLWGVVSAHSTDETRPSKSVKVDKREYDSYLLLLSVIVNCIEFSNDNRDALAGASVHLSWGQERFSQTQTSACDLFTKFFLMKVESYVHLMDLTTDQAQGAGGAISMDEGNDDWSPEDIILGGCTSLLLGYLMKGSSDNSTAILNLLPDSSPRLLLRALSVFVAVHSQIGALTPEVARSVLQVEKILKSYQDSPAGARTCAIADGDRETEHEIVEAFTPTCAGVDSTSQKVQDEAKRVNARKPAPSRPLKNLCSNIDDSDSESHPGEISKVKRRQTPHDQGTRTPIRTPPHFPGMKLPSTKSPATTPAAQVTPKRTPSGRSPLTAVLPDGTMSSPVVARLLRQTRQLVEEFDAEFSKPSRSSPAKKFNLEECSAPEGGSSPFMTLTMDVTCRDNGSEGLDVSLDVEEINSGPDGLDKTTREVGGRIRLQSKRRKKDDRDADSSARYGKSCISNRGLFDFTPMSSPPSTPLRRKNSKVLLRTPTRNGLSAVLSGQSPLLNLTPTKTPSSTPLRVKKSAEMLRTPTRLPATSESPVSASPHRRKAKSARAPPPSSASAVFDFTD